MCTIVAIVSCYQLKVFPSIMSTRYNQETFEELLLMEWMLVKVFTKWLYMFVKEILYWHKINRTTISTRCLPLILCSCILLVYYNISYKTMRFGIARGKSCTNRKVVRMFSNQIMGSKEAFEKDSVTTFIYIWRINNNQLYLCIIDLSI